MKIGIIGGGITGLTAAYELAKRNFQVEILEESNELGGIAGTFHLQGKNLEKYYHHYFKSDKYLISFLNEIGLEDSLKWHNTRMGYFTDLNLYDFGTPVSLIKFKPLGYIDKLRFGISVLKLMGTNNWKALEETTASRWMEHYAGKKAFENVWKPLLITKFGEDYDKISMAWLWGKIKLRGSSKEHGKEALGYLDGSNSILLDEIRHRLENMNASIITGCRVESAVKKDRYLLNTSKGGFEYDIVLSTVPLPVSINICSDILPPEYIDSMKCIEYTSTSCMVLTLDRQFTKYYWINIGDESIPFGGLIEHTNMLPPEEYGGNHILYISDYMYSCNPLYMMDCSELLREYIPYLKRVNHSFDESWIKDAVLFKDEYAQPVIKMRYSQKKPEFTTPVEGLFIANMCNIYPEDRGVNYAVRDGMRVAAEIIKRI